MLGGQPRPQGVGKFEVDARGARIIGIGEPHTGRQHRGGDIAVGAQPAVRAVVGALGESLGNPHTAQAVLAQRGGSGAGAVQLAAGGGAFAGHCGDEHSRAEQRDPFSPQPRPGGDPAVFHRDGVAVGGHDAARDLLGAGVFGLTGAARRGGVIRSDGAVAAGEGELWEVFSLQPRPDGTLTGEYSSTDSEGCAGKRTVTFTRTGDARVDLLTDPASLPARVASPAQGLHGRYHHTRTFASGAPPPDSDFVVRTDCLRGGDRCMSFFHNPTNLESLVFANGKWIYSAEYDVLCPAGGTSHVKTTADFPLPQPPQDPIAVLTGHGHEDSTGSTCTGGDYDDKFVRTGD